MANVVQILDELMQQLNKMKNVYQNVSLIPEPHRSPLDKLLLDNIDKWTRGTGSAFGHLAEFEQYYKHIVLKGRHAESAKGKGDVVIGRDGDPFAKTIQSKAVTSEGHNEVDNHIKKAVSQIAGLYHESPRKNDHLYISIMIMNSANAWPFTAHERSLGVPLMSAVRSRLESTVKNAINMTLMMSSSASVNTLNKNLSRPSYPTWKAPGKKTSAKYKEEFANVNIGPEFGVPYLPGLRPYYVVTPTFYVKIKWPFGYNVIDGVPKALVSVTLTYNAKRKDVKVSKEVYA